MAYRRYWVANVDGKAVKPVLCLNCRCAFVYEIHRRGSGQAEVGILTNDAEAKGAAREFAAQNLEEQLKTEVEPVPCPRCGFYQDDMVRLMAQRRFGWMTWVGGFLLCVGLLIAALDWLNHRRLSIFAALLWRRGAMFWLPGAAVLGLWHWLGGRFDPNADAESRAGKPAPTVIEIPKERYREMLESLEKSSVDV
jgi:hypothetical protein